MKDKNDKKLFRRYTRNSCEKKITEWQFADDAAILASTRSGAEREQQWSTNKQVMILV